MDDLPDPETLANMRPAWQPPDPEPPEPDWRTDPEYRELMREITGRGSRGSDGGTGSFDSRPVSLSPPPVERFSVRPLSEGMGGVGDDPV